MYGGKQINKYINNNVHHTPFSLEEVYMRCGRKYAFLAACLRLKAYCTQQELSASLSLVLVFFRHRNACVQKPLPSKAQVVIGHLPQFFHPIMRQLGAQL